MSLPEPRYTVHELEGFTIVPGNDRRMGGNNLPGFTVWVADEWLLGREMGLWRTEDNRWRGKPRVKTLRAIRGEAAVLADRLNSPAPLPIPMT